MAIFRRDSNSPPPSRSAPDSKGAPTSNRRSPDAQSGRGAITVIASGSRLEGKVSGSASLRIEGEIVGSLDLDAHVDVASGGRVEGDIGARSACIAGEVKGNIVGKELVEVTASGRLEGDVRAPRVVVKEGAFVKGNVQMTGGSGVSQASAGQKSTPSAGDSSKSDKS